MFSKKYNAKRAKERRDWSEADNYSCSWLLGETLLY